MCCKARLCPRPVIFLFRPVIAAASGEAKQPRFPLFSLSFQEVRGKAPMTGCTPPPVSFFELTGKYRRTAAPAATVATAPPVVAAARDHYV
jgi:hypothetical protein